jgi:hypothetical protein
MKGKSNVIKRNVEKVWGARYLPKNMVHVAALFWVGHHQVESRISEKTHTLQCGHLIYTSIESHNGDDATKDCLSVLSA